MVSVKYLLSLLMVMVFVPSLLANTEHSVSGPMILTLDDCFRMALETDTDLAIARMRLDVCREKIGAARRKLWPSLSLAVSDNSSLTDSSEYSQYDPSTGQTYVPGEGFQTSAHVTYPLFDHSARIAALHIERENDRIARLDIDQLRRDIIRHTFETYLAVLERKTELIVRQEQMTQAGESLKIAEERLVQGSGIPYEILLEEAYLAQSEAALSSAHHAVNQASRTLLILLHHDIDANVDLTPIKPSPPSTYDTDTIRRLIRTHRLEFQRTEAEIASYELQSKINRASRLPRFDLFANYSRQGTGLDRWDDSDESITAGISLRFSPFRDSTVAGSSHREWINDLQFMQKSYLSWDINDGTSIRSDELDLAIAIRKRRAELDLLSDHILTEALSALEEYQDSLIYYRAVMKTRDAAEEHHRIQQRMYELGINQFKDVVDARAELIEARIDLTRAEYASEQYRMNLLYTLGLLDNQESF
ncbi:TolC family protein [bacterium]|nr:TolC family protein [candidate division CSSED10-310 bacterium]